MIVFLDTETGGLDCNKHPLIEVAWSVGGGPIHELVMPHNIFAAEPKALEVNNYHDRGLALAPRATDDEIEGLWADLSSATLCGANPAFDAGFLKRFFESRYALVGGDKAPDPWKYRLLDIEAFAAGVLGLPGDPVSSLKNLTDQLTGLGHAIHEPDHTAAGDVRTLMDCYRVLREIQAIQHAS